MSQRNSEYARIEGDTYVTPQWVFDALYSVEQFFEPVDVAPVDAKYDFLTQEWVCFPAEIVTNPPFKLAEVFCRRAINGASKVAMLLPHAFDTAKGRVDLWGEPFKAKYTLTKRIRWENLEQKKNGPSMNHAWFVWDQTYEGKPFLGHLT
jgi:hypothetical protein